MVGYKVRQDFDRQGWNCVGGGPEKACVSGSRSHLEGDEAKREAGGHPTWPPSMEGTIKLGKSQGLHRILDFFPSFNKQY